MTQTMNETVLAAEEGGAAIHVGHHTMVFEMFGMTFNGDTIMATGITALIIIGLAFYLKSKVTSTGVPGGVQLFWEALTIQMRQQIEGSIGMKIAPFVLPLAVALFAFILISNWLAVFPWQYGGSDGAAAELYKPPASDINFVLALALFVFICYHAAGIWRRGPVGHPIAVVKGHVAFLAPINIVEELAKPISLALRLFGNIFAGGILVALIAMFPWYIQWLPNAIWKTFDLFVGLIQAFIFSLLTILYFSQSMEVHDDHEHDTKEHAH
ncbi:F0F1 ATP synthase subunit A [Mycobacterium adipatum]|jgi:F-type H+-transporting ATPase subunit a|uniref:ATP synthase subunit a n=2 Tax=Mycobacterium adipatum TaxID=1682113 RepID=A0A172UL06_9MYCO|nr:F0F1 ATP synthase subunit A [Mycobacterium adipatum]